MAKKEKINFRDLTKEELISKLRDSEEELFRLKFGHKIVPAKNPVKMRILKRTIAKLNTFLREKNA